jgi:hypothetical protein
MTARIDLIAETVRTVRADYGRGDSLVAIARRLGIAQTTMYKIAERIGLRRRPMSEAARIYRHDARAFEVASPARDYWVGFFLADGCLTAQTYTRTRVVSLGLKGTDRAHVEAFREFVGSNHPIRLEENRGFGKGGRLARLVIVSTALADSIERQGVAPRKSSREVMPESLRLSPAAWRGYLDGDGWVSVGRSQGRLRPTVGLTGSRMICEQFLEFAARHCPYRQAVRPNHSIWKVNATGPKVVDLLRLLYGGAGPALRRKHMLARAIIAADWS